MKHSTRAASDFKMRRIFARTACTWNLPRPKTIRHKTHFNLTDAELEAYRTSHMQKPPKYPYAPKKDEQEA